jgi:hypothetical protein
MFGERNIPFHGDYNWISLANTDPANPESPLIAYMSWTDNRDVVSGTDPREGSEQDGFDVKQCRVDLGEDTQGDRGANARPGLAHLLTVSTFLEIPQTKSGKTRSSEVWRRRRR